MHCSFRLALIGALAVSVALAGCQREPAPASAPAATTAPAKAVDKTLANQLVASPAWLRERLPEDSIAYLRIPSPWSMLSAPDGRPLDPLLANEAHVRMIDSIKHGLANDALIAKTGWQPLIKVLLSDMASPLEIAATGANKVASPASSFLASVRLRYANVAELNDTVAKLGAGQGVQLSKPFDAGSGDGEIAVGGKPVFGHFDAATQRLTLLAGMTANGDGLTSQLAAMAQPHAHAMQASEAKIDQSGQGLFVWISIEAIRSMASMGLNKPEQKFAANVVAQTRGIALGWGTVNGKGRVSLLVDAPGAKLLRYLPRSAKQPTLQTAGTPEWALSMSLPTAQELSQFQAALAEDFSAATAQQFSDAMLKMKAEVGFDLGDVLQAIGPEVTAICDASGHYTAIRLRDAAKFETLIKQLVAKYKFEYETRDIGGATFHHLNLSFSPQMDNAAKSAEINPWLQLYARIGNHNYWIEQDGNLLLSGVPQTLIDYRNAKSRTPLAAWLTQTQGLDAKQALLAATVRTREAQRSVYAAYLQGLQVLADVAGVHVDMFTLPSPDALALQRDGALGLQVRASDDEVGADFIFEQSPLETFTGATGANSTMTSVAVVAILAAIALPAYQDYTVRAHVSEGLMLSEGVKVAIAEYYINRSKLPRDLAAIGIKEIPSGQYTQSVRVEDGVVVITLNAAAGTGMADHSLRLTPYANTQGALEWQCGTAAVPAGAKVLVAPHPNSAESVPAKYLPTSCRP